MTVIYGENASGKSGYSRVLKKACLARERKSDILPNVFEHALGKVPQATFDLDIDGTQAREEWTANTATSEALSQIAVFDSACARVFVDEANDVVYTPYGLDIFSKLAALCKAFKGRLKTEIDALPEPPRVLSEFSPDTVAGKCVRQLRHDTPADSVEELAVISDSDIKKLEKLSQFVAESKVNAPKSKAETLRRQKRRFEKLLAAIQKAERTLSAEHIERLQTLRADAETAKAAASLASSKAFEREPLSGVGSDPWRQMFEAARRYSELTAYPRQSFPVTGDGVRCVLCQQTLEQEAKQRLERFADFVRQDTAKASAEKSSALDREVEDFNKTDFQPDKDDPELLSELRDIEAEAADKLAIHFDYLRTRAEAIQESLKDGKWERIPGIEASPVNAIPKVVNELEAKAGALDAAAKPEEQTKLGAELQELEDRRRLVDHKKDILEHLRRLRHEYCLNLCVAATDTNAITRKETKLTEESVTGKLEEALTKELNALSLSHLPIALEKTGRYGQTRHKLQLSGNRLGKGDLSDILSEGEQSVLGIASFLAELETSSDNCAIVFDDPVCSMDHLYRERIAERLVGEGLNRQVIIFTHDIVFLLSISQAAAKQQVPLLTQTIRRQGEKPGYCETGLPWNAMTVKERLQHLRKELDKARAAHKDGDTDGYEGLTSRIYGLLRETWERAIEEVVLNDAINRFRPSIETMRLKSVVLEDSDYVKIDSEMSRCSTLMAGHDVSGAIASPMPDPPVVEQDLRTLKAFVKEVRKRHETVRKGRDSALKPPSAT